MPITRKIALLFPGALLLPAGCGLVLPSERPPHEVTVNSRPTANTDLLTRANAVSLTDEKALLAMRQEISDKRSAWRGSDVQDEIASRLLKINAALALMEKTRWLVDALNGIEKQLETDPPVEVLAKLFSQVHDAELAEQALDAGGGYETRYVAAVKLVTDKYVDALRAKATAAASATTGEGLAPYGELEDTLRKVLDGAMAANDVATLTRSKAAYEQCVTEIDAIVEKLFDDAYIEKVAWTDLLADPAAWYVVSAPSFSHSFAEGLKLDNAEGGASGGLLYMPGTPWRDYVLELGVTLDSGILTVYTRVGDENRMDTKVVPGFTYGAKDTKYTTEYGKSHTLTVRVIGKQMLVSIDGTAQPPEALGLTLSRHGKPCLAVRGGTSARITSLRVRLLR